MKKKFNPNQLVLDLFGVEKATTVNEAHIREFKRAYWADDFGDVKHKEIGEAISDEFIKRLARDAAESKKDLRVMMERSANWSEELQAWNLPFDTKVPVTPDTVKRIIRQMWQYAREGDNYGQVDIYDAANYFVPGGIDETSAGALESILGYAPRPEMKKSKLFAKVSKALGVYTTEKESLYQRLEGKLFTTLAAPFIDGAFLIPKKGNLFVSINPAHFLSMSNPKHVDGRKNSMTSCHSLNGDDIFKSGCSGYARDKTSIIAFTAAKGADAMLNRKTARQVFFYKNGALIQSRLYTSDNSTAYGGVSFAEDHWEYNVFRRLIQKEIARCERREGFGWTLADYRTKNELNRFGVEVRRDANFGGYVDWEMYAHNEGMILASVRADKLDENGFWLGWNKPIIGGAAGLNVRTSKTIERHESIVA